MKKALADCQHDAAILAELLEGLHLMDQNSDFSGEVRASLLIVALEKSRQLAADLDGPQVVHSSVA